MTDYTFFETATGKIISNADLADMDEANLTRSNRPGQDYILGTHNRDTHWVSGGMPAVRPVIPPMTGPTYDLNDLPAGGRLEVTDPYDFKTEIPAQDQTLNLNEAATYRVKSVCPFPYINFDEEIEVTV